MVDFQGKRELLSRGIIAARVGEKAEAIRYLEHALSYDLPYEDALEAWIWLSEVVDDPIRKRACLESALAINISEPRARRKLAILDGKLAPEDMVNPDTLRRAGDSGPALCAECGAPLFFDASGTERHCERCGWRPTDVVRAGDPDTLLERGIAAAKARQEQEAQRCLRAVTQHTAAGDEKRITAWLWLSGVVETVAEKRACLEAVVRIDPKHPLAWRGLAHLETQGGAEATSASGVTGLLSGKRMVCKQCGAKLSYDVEHRQLGCAYCGAVQRVGHTFLSGTGFQKHDFAATLPTAKGHTRPEEIRSLKCGGCGATFVPAPGVLSLTCSYCGSAHVASLSAAELIAPQAIVPFTISEVAAQQALETWLQRNGYAAAGRSAHVRGLYFPVWIFDVGGGINWHCVLYKHQGRGITALPRSGVYYLDLPDVPVPASHTLSIDFTEELDAYDFKQLQPYDPVFLVNWPAEAYNITVADASIVARQQFREHIARLFRVSPTSIIGELGGVHNLHFSTAQMTVNAYQLVLLPVWLTSYTVEETLYQVFINGQTGRVRGQAPPNLLRGFLKLLFG